MFIVLAGGFHARETFFSRSTEMYVVGELIYSSYAATEAINTFHAQVSTTLSTESAWVSRWYVSDEGGCAQDGLDGPRDMVCIPSERYVILDKPACR